MAGSLGQRPESAYGPRTARAVPASVINSIGMNADAEKDADRRKDYASLLAGAPPAHRTPPTRRRAKLVWGLL
jgi:hypothetical protein